MADGVEVLDGSVRKNNAVVCLIIDFIPFALFKQFLNALLILRMIAVKPRSSRR
jgi:hypothetical protein